jgi:hypothetical protein
MNRQPAGIAARIRSEIERIEGEIARWERSGIQRDESWRAADSKRLSRLRRELELEVSRKRVVVLGTIHEYQMAGRPLNSELCSRIQFLMGQFAATTVLEEWTENGSQSCVDLNFKDRCEYANVGTSSQEEFSTYVCHPVNHPAHDGILGSCDDAPSMSEYGPLDQQENREIRMLRNIERAMGKHHVGLFVVGLAHLHSMSMKLKAAKFNVNTYSWLG